MTDNNDYLILDSTGNKIIGCRADATEILIPGNVTDIAEGAFCDCASLKAFTVAVDNTKFTAEDGVLYSKNGSLIVSYPQAKADVTFTLPENVMLIARNAFRNCGNLKVVTFLGRVIGECAFFGCTNLLEVRLGDSLRGIESKAFSECPSLLRVCIPEGAEHIADDAFDEGFTNSADDVEVEIDDIVYSAYGSTLIRVLETWKGSTVIVPNNISRIADGAFAGCKSLKKIILPSGVLEVIGSRAFQGCEALEAITLTIGLRVIGDFAFADCNSLKVVEIPVTINTIGEGAFASCFALREVSFAVFDPAIVNVHETAFEAADNCILITNSDFAKKECESNAAFNAFKEIITLKTWAEGEVTNKAEAAARSENHLVFDNTGNIVTKCDVNATEVIVPQGVTRIEGNAFEGCEKLTSVVLPDTVESIGCGAFNNCVALESVVLPAGLRQLNNNAFTNCKALRFVAIPNSLSFIDFHTFEGCESLKSVVIPESIESVSIRAFAGCKSLREVHLKHIDSKKLKIRRDSFADIGECTLYVPSVALQSFKEHKRFAAIFRHIKPESRMNGILEFFKKLWK